MKLMVQRKKRKTLGLLMAINAVLLFLLYSNIFIYPNTYISSINISGNTTGHLRQQMQSLKNQKLRINVKERLYTYTYDQMGIILDDQKLIADAFGANRNVFPLNLFLFVQSFTTREIISPPLVFTQAFEQFVADTIFDFNASTDEVLIDPVTKSLFVEENSESYRFDKEQLKSLLIEQFGIDRPLYPMLTKNTIKESENIAGINQKLSAVFGNPIIVYLDLGGTVTAIELKEEDIREAVDVNLDKQSKDVSIRVNKESLNRVLTRRTRESGFPIRDSVVTQHVVNDFSHLVELRFGGTQVSAVVTKLDDGANTNGTLANKYIEVDISQQKMYLFDNGKIKKEYVVSTGYDYPTPVGEFKIINKVGLGFSNIYNVWLPWWMGFSYSDDLNAYFGIHEQPYVLTQDGQTVIADPRPIGTPSTGGCVALSPGAAREVYVFATVGTPVVIFE